MKSAMEIKEQTDIKRKEYIDSLNFDNLYSEINNRIEKVSLFNSYVAITYKEMLEYLSSGIELDKDLNAMGAKEQKLFIDIVLNIVVSKLKSLKYIVTSYDKQLSFFK